jgi:hypothetical protein
MPSDRTLKSAVLPRASTGVNTREEFPDLLNRLGLSGYGIELGVAGGYFSNHLLANSRLSLLFSVDRWADHHNDQECESARQLLGKWGARSVVLRMTFEEAGKLFRDSLLDFAYLDGYAHAGQDGIATLDTWWSKVRSGGVFAGHDYHSRWPKTVEVVNQFVAKYGLRLYTTNEVPDLVQHIYPSWYVFK